MKKINIILVLSFLVVSMQAQTFDFSLSFMGINESTNNYQVALIATPNGSVTNGVTADMGAGFYLPSGLSISSFTMGDSAIPASEWRSSSLGSNASGDGIYIYREESGTSSIMLDGAGPFQLVLFDVKADSNPITDGITLMENGDSLLEANFVEDYVNINLGGGTANAYRQNNQVANAVDFSALGIDGNKLTSNSVSIHPNPASDVINIASMQSIDSVEMFDVLGKKVLTSTGTKEIKVNHLPVGVYILKIYSDETSITKKVIIE